MHPGFAAVARVLGVLNSCSQLCNNDNGPPDLGFRAIRVQRGTSFHFWSSPGHQIFLIFQFNITL